MVNAKQILPPKNIDKQQQVVGRTTLSLFETQVVEIDHITDQIEIHNTARESVITRKIVNLEKSGEITNINTGKGKKVPE